MNLVIDKNMSFGDFIMCTGIPKAWYTCFKERVYIPNKRAVELWENNPYVSDVPLGKNINVTANAHRDYMIYYPVRIFYDISGGLIVDRELVQPDIYQKREPIKKRILVNDQAGWPTRTGYPYLNDLVTELRAAGYSIGYLRNEHFRNCFGQIQNKQLVEFDYSVTNIMDNKVLIRELLQASFYIGYDSGISQLAGALKIPYVALQCCVPPINTVHDSCIHYLDICQGYCCSPDCKKKCFAQSPDFNSEIIKAIEEYNDDVYNRIL